VKTCNWFWGSHGCDLDPGHAGHHLCGILDPCSKHDGARVLFPYVDGDWSDEWLDSPYGFCLPDPKHGMCGDPENCSNRASIDHVWKSFPISDEALKELDEL
jgi:hypothetical protein